MAEILVTGGTGLLGSSLLRCFREDHNVTVLARRVPDEAAGVRWIHHDLRAATLPAALPPRIDTVIHLAQAREFRDFPARARDIYAVNVASTALLLDWAFSSGAKRFILASTGGVYSQSDAPHHEGEPIHSSTLQTYYSSTKLSSEALAGAYSSYFTVVILRPFFIYGRCQDPDMLLPRMTSSLRSGKPISIAGDDGMLFNPIHVSDATRAVMAALLLRESTVINLAGPQVLSLRQACELLAAELGMEAHFEHRSAGSPTSIVGDISRMQGLLGAPGVSLADVTEELCRPYQ